MCHIVFNDERGVTGNRQTRYLYLKNWPVHRQVLLLMWKVGEIRTGTVIKSVTYSYPYHYDVVLGGVICQLYTGSDEEMDKEVGHQPSYLHYRLHERTRHTVPCVGPVVFRLSTFTGSRNSLYLFSIVLSTIRRSKTTLSFYFNKFRDQQIQWR